jgi:hypothetical protein
VSGALRRITEVTPHGRWVEVDLFCPACGEARLWEWERAIEIMEAVPKSKKKPKVEWRREHGSYLCGRACCSVTAYNGLNVERPTTAIAVAGLAAIDRAQLASNGEPQVTAAATAAHVARREP